MGTTKFVVFVLFAVACAAQRPIVNTKLGTVRGLQADDGDYSMYLGVPYGVVDERRPFGDSTPHPPFDDVFDAIDDSVHCPQQNEVSKEIEGEFGCLHMNIYVPNNVTHKNIPILVWLHGGRYVQGDSSRYLYGPKFLMRHDIIFITFNYRLGPYGFLCFESPNAPGNQGLKDQVLALRWIKSNIEAFGGDPNRVTLMGESVGANFVEVHLSSPNERLFDAAIVHSGSIFGIKSITPRKVNNEIAVRLSRHLGFNGTDTEEIIDFLSKADHSKVIKASFDLQIQYTMCIERSYENVTSILTKYPDYLPFPEHKIVPILGGFTNNEDLVTYKDNTTKFLVPTFFRDYLQDIFEVDEEMLDVMRTFYIGNEDISPAVKFSQIDFSSDLKRAYVTQRSLLRYMRAGAVVYQFLFSYSGVRNYVKNRFNVTEEGATHADDMSFIFDISYDKRAPPADQLVIDRVTKMWTNFVKYRNPTPTTDELLPVKWPPISEKQVHYLDINNELTLGKRPFHQRMAFLDLFFKAYEKKLKSYIETYGRQ